MVRKVSRLLLTLTNKTQKQMGIQSSLLEQGWSLKDYLNTFASNNIEDYTKAKKIVESYSEIDLEVILAMLAKGHPDLIEKDIIAIRNGTFECIYVTTFLLMASRLQLLEKDFVFSKDFIKAFTKHVVTDNQWRTLRNKKERLKPSTTHHGYEMQITQLLTNNR